MTKWGCRSDPSTWKWSHLTEKIEDSLRKSKVRQLGDAWMMAMAILEEESELEYESKEGERSAWQRDFERERQECWGGTLQGARFTADLGAGGGRWLRNRGRAQLAACGSGGGRSHEHGGRAREDSVDGLQ